MYDTMPRFKLSGELTRNSDRGEVWRCFDHDELVELRRWPCW
jgi:hypothetical protein